MSDTLPRVNARSAGISQSEAAKPRLSPRSAHSAFLPPTPEDTKLPSNQNKNNKNNENKNKNKNNMNFVLAITFARVGASVSAALKTAYSAVARAFGLSTGEKTATVAADSQAETDMDANNMDMATLEEASAPEIEIDTGAAVASEGEAQADAASAPIKEDMAVDCESDDTQDDAEDATGGKTPEEETAESPLTSEDALEWAMELVHRLEHVADEYKTALGEAMHREAALAHKLTATEARLASLAISYERLGLVTEDREAAAVAGARCVVDAQAAQIIELQDELAQIKAERDGATREMLLARDATREAELAKTSSDEQLFREHARLELVCQSEAQLKHELERLKARVRALQLESASATEHNPILVDVQLACLTTFNEQLHAELEDHAAGCLAAMAALNKARRVVDTQTGRVGELERNVHRLTVECVDSVMELSSKTDTIRELQLSKGFFEGKFGHEQVRHAVTLHAKKQLDGQVGQLETQVRSLQLEIKALASAAASASLSSAGVPTQPLSCHHGELCSRSSATGTVPTERKSAAGAGRNAIAVAVSAASHPSAGRTVSAATTERHEGVRPQRPAPSSDAQQITNESVRERQRSKSKSGEKASRVRAATVAKPRWQI